MTGPKAGAFPVAIVGGGPVGMVLALLLAQLGVRSVLVEQDDETLWHPKGNTHNARTMEHYRKLGVADELRALGLPQDWPTDVTYLTQMHGRELFRHVMPSTREKIVARAKVADPLDQIPEPLQRVNQMFVERAVHAHVLAEPLIETRYGHRLERIEHDADGVALFSREAATGREVRIHADYLVGCDGPRSVVRETLGFRYSGEDSFGDAFMSGQMLSTYLRIRSKDGRPVKATKSWQYWLLRPTYIANLISLDGEDEYIFGAPGLGKGDIEGLRSRVKDCVGFDVDVEVVSAREWMSGRALVAEHYREGRVFLSGDAVHLFTPTGGFGMNTGIDDAANLAWKLAATVQGWGGPRLLDTYESERRPIGVRNSTVARAHAGSIMDIKLSDALGEASPEGDTARAACAAILSTMKEEFASIGIQLGARYDDSPLIAHEPGAAPPVDDPAVYTPTSLPGGRAPHLWLADGSSLYDHLGAGFALLHFDPDIGVEAITVEAAKRGIPLRVVDVDLPAARALYPQNLALIRPDQHVAWRGDRLGDAAALLDMAVGA